MKANDKLDKSSLGWKPAFKHQATGKIVHCDEGYHDLNVLPDQNDQGWDSGFVDHTGNYYSREQAKQKLNLMGTSSGALHARQVQDGTLSKSANSLMFRGITQPEHDYIAQNGHILSNGSYCAPGEGTCFGSDFDTSESYVNFGHTSPVATGKPTYVLEVQSGPDVKVDKDGYPKAQLPIPSHRIRQVYRFNPDMTMETGTWKHGVGFVSNGDKQSHPWRKDPSQWGVKMNKSEDLEKKAPEYAYEPPVKMANEYHFNVRHSPTKKLVGKLVITANPIADRKSLNGYHSIKNVDVSMSHQRKGIYASLLQQASQFSRQLGGKGVASMGEWRSEPATGAWNKLAAKKPKAVKRFPGVEEGAEDFAFSEDELEKMQTPPTFPQLGVPDNRRETPIVTSQADLIVKRNAIRQDQAQVYHDMTGKSKDLPVPKAAVGMTSPSRNMSYSLGNNLRANTARGQSPKAPLATVNHENFHLLFNRIAEKHGRKAKKNLIHNLWNAIAPEDKKSVQDFVSHKYGGKEIHPSQWHEEHLVNMLNYLNSPIEREIYHKEKGLQSGSESPVDLRMKRAFRAVQKAAKIADKHWISRVIPSEHVGTIVKKSEGEWRPSFEEQERAFDLLNAATDNMPEFQAAKFLANQYTPSPLEIDEALLEHEGDHVAAALYAHRLPVTEENIRLLKKVMEMQGFNKSEFVVTAIPRVVKPFNEDAVQFAADLQAAFDSKQVQPISLNGKHSAGTAIVHIDDALWLLKPGSGNLSPALGVAEEKANQSRREVAFNTVARIMGLGKYVPRAKLVLIDNKEVAALEFFSNDFKPVQKWRQDKGINLANVFGKFVQNGLLYKWAALDYILGQADRHAGNIMLDDGDNVRFIDAGSAFAGPSFNPAVDPKSFVPFYLRVFGGRKFKVLTPKEKFDTMPKPSNEAEGALKHWADDISDGQIVAILSQFGINPQPVINRLNSLRAYPGPKSEFLRKFYSNLL